MNIKHIAVSLLLFGVLVTPVTHAVTKDITVEFLSNTDLVAKCGDNEACIQHVAEVCVISVPKMDMFTRNITPGQYKLGRAFFGCIGQGDIPTAVTESDVSTGQVKVTFVKMPIRFMKAKCKGAMACVTRNKNPTVYVSKTIRDMEYVIGMVGHEIWHSFGGRH